MLALFAIKLFYQIANLTSQVITNLLLTDFCTPIIGASETHLVCLLRQAKVIRLDKLPERLPLHAPECDALHEKVIHLTRLSLLKEICQNKKRDLLRTSFLFLDESLSIRKPRKKLMNDAWTMKTKKFSKKTQRLAHVGVQDVYCCLSTEKGNVFALSA